LALAYVEAAQASGEDFFTEVAQDTLEYVLREMTDGGGGFYSAEDADSIPPERSDEPVARPSEGAFYLWRADELERLLGVDAEIAALRFGVERGGNAPSDPQQEFVGKNLLYVARSVEEIATRTCKAQREVADTLARARAAMFAERQHRPRPQRDDKILAAWN